MKRLSFFLALAVCVGVLLTLSSTPAFAQGETGSVTGVVTDAQGGTVAGADVTLTDVATKSPRTTTTTIREDTISPAFRLVPTISRSLSPALRCTRLLPRRS